MHEELNWRRLWCFVALLAFTNTFSIWLGQASTQHHWENLITDDPAQTQRIRARVEAERAEEAGQ